LGGLYKGATGLGSGFLKVKKSGGGVRNERGGDPKAERAESWPAELKAKDCQKNKLKKIVSLKQGAGRLVQWTKTKGLT